MFVCGFRSLALAHMHMVAKLGRFVFFIIVSLGSIQLSPLIQFWLSWGLKDN